MAAATLAASVLMCPIAEAATVSVGATVDNRYPGYGTYGPDNDAALYRAAPGEANRLLVSYAGDAESVTLTDPGATITAGPGCTSVDMHTAVCRASRHPFIQHTEAELGDGDDEVRTYRPTPFPIGGVVAFGGPGDDLLDGGAGSDELDGGGGRDTMLGGAGHDVVTDGDRSGSNVGSDTLDGGDGLDLVAYRQRTAGVQVDIADGSGDGEPGEDDVVRAFEDITGGSGNDRLFGDDDSNALRGEGGDDLLVGRGGEADADDNWGDRLYGGRGADRLEGGDGEDALDGEGDRDSISCGGADDSVSDPQGGEVIESRCEEVSFYDVEREGGVRFDPHPAKRSRRSAYFRLPCPEYDGEAGEFVPCPGSVKMREASGARRVLGRGRVRYRRAASTPPLSRVRLTSTGRRLARRRQGVVVTVSIRGRRWQLIAWSIRLRVPR